jgi:hypothetical protein
MELVDPWATTRAKGHITALADVVRRTARVAFSHAQVAEAACVNVAEIAD